MSRSVVYSVHAGAMREALLHCVHWPDSASVQDDDAGIPPEQGLYLCAELGNQVFEVQDAPVQCAATLTSTGHILHLSVLDYLAHSIDSLLLLFCGVM